MMVTVAALGSMASAPAEARGGRVRVGTGVAIAAAVAAGVAADAYYSGYAPGYYYAPRQVYYGGPLYVHHRGWYAY